MQVVILYSTTGKVITMGNGCDIFVNIHLRIIFKMKPNNPIIDFTANITHISFDTIFDSMFRL